MIRAKPAKFAARQAHMATVVILDTGLRLSEVLALTRDSVDLDGCTIRVRGKGNKQREAPFSTELRRFIFKHLKNVLNRRDDNLFHTHRGRQLTVRNFLCDCKLLGRSCGLSVRGPHWLRHCFAVNYLRRGGNLEYLCRSPGHSSISTTQIYLRPVRIEDLQSVHDSLPSLARRGDPSKVQLLPSPRMNCLFK
jgi:integrase/recombinase XerD